MTAWIGIIGTVVGALLAGAAAWLNSRFQLRRQEERERNRHILSKLEQLYEIIAQYKIEELKSFNIQVRRIGKRLPLDTSDMSDSGLEKIEMLAGFYAKSLQSTLAEFAHYRYQLGTILMRYAQLNTKSGDVISDDVVIEILREYKEKTFAINELCTKIQSIIVELSKEYL